MPYFKLEGGYVMLQTVMIEGFWIGLFIGFAFCIFLLPVIRFANKIDEIEQLYSALKLAMNFDDISGKNVFLAVNIGNKRAVERLPLFDYALVLKAKINSAIDCYEKIPRIMASDKLEKDKDMLRDILTDVNQSIWALRMRNC